ncbi:ABC-type Fe3+ transport system permease subunit [Nocardioides ginsengisegetis]|uniref:ABC-type Fe3+ transport system permease subunit n=1 Tax=Nocardioides ginsengisegetis TaxID=661491 RepID=A0A7W3IZW2_9ACTN|nr:hypothetical protein [Nocardioides ginsengisegetis]MBA8803687.1 ABC-type Fe3+ transport system permease subunit [Nocardioides ginsengisegetis]
MTRRVAIAIVIGVVLVAAVVGAIALHRNGGDARPAGLSVTWGGSEGHPTCTYDDQQQTVRCTLMIGGTASGSQAVTVTVTAYADENTSRPVGSASGTAHVEGTVHQPLVVTVPVRRAPHVDEDQVAACTFEVTY